MPSKEQTFVAVLKGAERRRTMSESGNPRFKIHTDEGTFNTLSDAAISYDVENRTTRPDGPRAESSWIGKRVRFTATGAGQITGWELAE
jgi:hypothetical protein